MKRIVYAALGVVVLGVAALMIYRALSESLVYFILPSEYAEASASYDDRRIRLGGIVEPGTVAFHEEDLRLDFAVTDSLASYQVRHYGAPPELFQENTGVVIEGRFQDGTFQSDELLVKHSEVYEAPDDGEPIDVEALKDTLQ